MADVRRDEWFEVVDERDQVVGKALRSRCHGDPSLIHRAAHVLVFNRSGQLLLQKRAADKQIQPNRWDSSVGGHLEPGEDYHAAAVREMQEELGIAAVPLTFLFRSQIRNQIESENVTTYLARQEGPFDFCRREISEVRFWSHEDIDAALGSGLLTPNFEEEWGRYLEWSRSNVSSEKERVGLCAGDSSPDVLARLSRP